ncbi:MAG: LysR family transcriptional regulator [Hylemonella sp.]
MEKADIRLLRAFLVLMAERGVSRAGERLGLSQPAASRTLHRLRKLFHDPILIRSRQGMVATDRSIDLEARVKDLLLAYDQIVSQPEVFKSSVSHRTFTVSAPEFAERLLVPALLRDWRLNAKNIRIVIATPDPQGAFDKLERGELDLRIAWLTAPTKSLRSAPLFNDNFVCIAASDHPVIKGALTLEQFLSLPHARGQSHTTTSSVLDEAVERKGHRLSAPFLVQNYQTIPDMLLGTDLIATVPKMLAREYQARYPIRILEPPIRLPIIRYAAYWHERNQHDAGHRWFRSRLMSAARELVV